MSCLLTAVGIASCQSSAPAAAGLEATGPSFAWPQDPDAHQVGHPLDSARFTPCTPATPRLTSDSIGPAFSGQAQAQLQQACPAAQPAWAWGEEGILEPALLVRLGETVVTAVLEDTLASSRVYRVLVHDTLPRTVGGVGVGSTWAELVRLYGTPLSIEEAECVLYVVFPAEPLLSWQLHLGPDHECEAVAAVARGGPDAAVPAHARVWRVTQFLPLPGHRPLP